MNINDPDVDLTLALGSGNCTRVNSNSGAGVNANSRKYFPFAASDPLSELVWSPHNGLSLKCANSNMVDKKTFFTWNVDEAKKDISTSRSSRGIKVSNEKNMRMFRSSGGTSSSNLDAYHRNCEVKVSETLGPSSHPNLQPRDEEVRLDANKNKSSLMMLESSAENDLAGKDRAPTDSRRICLYQEKGKGKEKASSNGDMWARSSSHESMESCNSTGLFPRGVKRLNFGEPQMIMGSKRTRKLDNEGVKPDSSFMNWISNMVKGLSDYSKRDPSPLNVVLNQTPDCATPSIGMGFQTVFQSMYHPRTTKAVAEADERKNENSCKQLVLASTPNSSSEKTGLNLPLPTPNPFSSLWITRLYTKNDRLEKCSSECRNRANDVLSGGAEEMASVFAKRLDALRHMIKQSTSLSCQLLCLFCGRRGHDLRKCPNLTATELNDLLVKSGSFDKVEESPCLCIRCFQLDHWAISCPRSDDKCSSKRPSTSNLLQKSSSSISEHHKHVFPPRKIVVPEEGMFNAISKLRLSRANILRWMNSDVPLSHLNGFFLRLRVGKLEGGLEGTTYYVACITESMNSKSKKSILVDVGGMRSSVGSQYISNHDFLEDEIKAWWSRIVKNGCKIPLLDELNSKCEHKKHLSL